MQTVLVRSLITVALASACAATGHAKGLDMTCGDFIKMTHAEQRQVMREAGIDSDLEQRVEYYAADCRNHPEDAGYPIGNIQG